MLRIRKRTVRQEVDAPTRPAQPVLEVQYHPGDIRKGVRYIFLSRREVTLWSVGIGLFVVFIGLGLAIMPAVVRQHLIDRGYQEEKARRALYGDRLQELVQTLRTIEEKSDAVRVEMAKIYLAYGFSYESSIGQGGYPFEAAEVPASIYSRDIREGNGLQARIGEQMAVLETFLQEVQGFEAAHRDQVRSTPSVSPLRGDGFVLTSPFGTRRSPFTKEIDFHAGIDLAAPVGTPIYAPADGVVSFAGRFPLKKSVGWWRYGNLIVLRNGERFFTLFGHCDEISVRTGQRVTQGEVLGTVGNSGWSTSPHLHYEVRRRRGDEEGFEPVDPRIYILDHRWRDEERLLVRSRTAPERQEYEPLPSLVQRR